MLQVLAGFDPQDPCSAFVPVPDMVARFDGRLDNVRIGVPRAYFLEAPDLNPEVQQAVQAALDRMAAAGATVVDVALPHAALGRNAQNAIMFGECYAYHETDLQTRPELYGKWTRQQLRKGVLYTAADFVQAQRVRSLIKREVAQALANVDVLAMPTSLVLPPQFDAYDPDSGFDASNFMAIWNLTGNPAMSICCGFSESTLPIGLQIVGQPFDEPTVFKVADAYQRITDWHTRTPNLTLEVAA